MFLLLVVQIAPLSESVHVNVSRTKYWRSRLCNTRYVNSEARRCI